MTQSWKSSNLADIVLPLLKGMTYHSSVANQ